MTRAPIDPSSLEAVTQAARAGADAARGGVRVGGRVRLGAAALPRRLVGLRRPGRRRAGAGRPAGGPGRRARRVLLVRDGDGALRGWFNVCRHRGHELLAPGATPEGPGDPLPVPRLGATGWAASAGRRRGSASPPTTGSTAPSSAWCRPGSSSGTAGCSRTSPATRRRWPSSSATPRMVVDGYDAAAGWCSAPGTSTRSRRTGRSIVENYLECYHCAPIHPELCEVTPPESGTGYPAAPVGSWVGGPLRAAGRRADDVAGRAQPRRADPGAAGDQDAARSATRRCCRRCWSARIRTT